MKQVFVILGVLIVIGLGFFVYSTTACVGCVPEFSQNSFQTINSVDFNKKISEDVVLIDIRTPSEFNSGHIEGALNIDFYSPTFNEEIDSLDKSKSYAIYCRTGSRTSKTINLMNSLGFEEVYELDGGITSWTNSNFPIVY